MDACLLSSTSLKLNSTSWLRKEYVIAYDLCGIGQFFFNGNRHKMIINKTVYVMYCRKVKSFFFSAFLGSLARSENETDKDRWTGERHRDLFGSRFM